MTLLLQERILPEATVPQVTQAIRAHDISDGLSAVVMSSWSPAVPVSKIGERPMNVDLAFSQLLHEASAAEHPRLIT